MVTQLSAETIARIARLATALSVTDGLFRVNNKLGEDARDRYFIMVNKRTSIFGIDKVALAQKAAPVLAVLKELAANDPTLVTATVKDDTYTLSKTLVHALKDQNIKPSAHLQVAALGV